MDCADCANCPLRTYWEKKGTWQPVPFEGNGSDILVLGDAPSKQDAVTRRPFTDAHGITVMEELRRMGVGQRFGVDWGNLLGCRWPDDNPKTYLAKLKGQNRRRVKAGKKPLQSPLKACWGYVEKQLGRYTTVLTLGPHAAKALLEGNPALEAVRGGPTKAGALKVLPTYHPRLLQVKPELREVFAIDVAKMLRWHDDALMWQDPVVHYQPTPEFAAEWYLANQGKQLAYDVETDGVDSLTAGLRCIGIGTVSEVLMLGFLSVDGKTRLYSPSDEAMHKKLLRKVFTHTAWVKVGHNAGYFDRTVIEQHLGVTPAPLIDTILLHKLAASEHKHRLGFVASMLLDVPAWKADHTGVTAQTDRDLHEYCATDVAVTARVVRPLQGTMAYRRQEHLYTFDAKVQDLCAGMHRLGMRVDERRRAQHEAEQTAEATKWLRVIQEARPGLNPRSTAQMRELLFNDWGLPPHDYTDAGEPRTNAASVRNFLVNPLLDAEQKKLLKAIKFYRRADKLLGTYLRKLAPGAGVVTPEGYVHPDYNSHGTVTGRLSSSNPNFQNIPFFLRDMFIPPPGCVFVGADYDQLELRFAAALAGTQNYLDAFEKQEIDPHNLTADLMFGDKFWQAQGAPDTKMGKGKGQFKKLRNLAKGICFSSLYGAAPPKVLEIIHQAEDDEGNMLYADLDLRQVRTLHRTWLQRASEFKAWWNQTTDELRHLGYLTEPVLKRRRYFADMDYNAALNYRVQAGGFAVVAKAMIELVEKHLPFDYGQRTGLVNQLHDAVLFAVPESRADQVSQIVTETLTSTVAGLPVTFTAEAEVGETWKDV
tara:strand:+ start:45 stop:2498 length:2454 start_codon:yes stop_codon:yes gene_type:complete